MTVEADLTTVLKTVMMRVKPDFAPVSTVRPYCTFQQIGGEAVTYLERAVVSKKNGEFQITVWSNTRAEAMAKILLIEAALITATVFQATPLSAPVADFDADVPIYGARQDFSIWSDR